MNTRQLTEAILDGGIRSTNFFNGRLLSAEDLSSEQQANREVDKLIGRSIGDGVSYGFEVSRAAGAGTNATVTIQAGLAINRSGQALRLSNAIDLSLVRQQDSGSTAGAAGFSQCTPFQSGVYVSGSGVYLLVVSPARGSQGRATVSGLQSTTSDCNTKYLVDGVQFRLIQLELSADELTDANHLRNLVAYRCFGADEADQVLMSPFGAEVQSYGLLDTLRPNRLTDCDVPLAVLYWTSTGGIGFVDMWSVRRRLSRTSLDGKWSTILSERRTSEAEATFLQFADQLEGLRTSGAQSVVATAYFRYLPALGVLPLATGASPFGFSFQTFFQNQTYRSPVFVSGPRAHSMIRSAINYPPIDLLSGEMVWLYEVRENRDPRAFAPAAAPVEYAIFASGHIPFQGEARFDVARWNYSNYS